MKLITFLLYISLTTLPILTKNSPIPDFKRNPVVYGLSAISLSYGHEIKGLVAIRQRLPEIKELGVNIIWLQPISPAFEEDGQGYDVIDYMSVWEQLGTEEDLKALIEEAHRLGIKVMLDMVLNHSSFKHPFVLDVAEKGKKSPYYDYYQHEPIDGIPYDEHFHKKKIRQGSFVYYFWELLLNFNYNHMPLRKYLFEMLKYWVEEYDIDGYRFDASWGPSSRWPKFYKTISQSLQKVKPDIILMAEDMAGYPISYEGTNHPHLKGSGFDWAYDWNNEDPYWVSKWSFQVGDTFEETVFNLEDPEVAVDAFIHAVGLGTSKDGIKTVRYIENNDMPGFLRYHSEKEARWAAKIMFLLPGVPLIFYGQEVGNHHDANDLPSFDPEQKMRSYNPGLWDFYRDLVGFRRGSLVLCEGTMGNLRKVTPVSVAFDRELGDERVIVELRFDSKTVLVDSKEL